MLRVLHSHLPSLLPSQLVLLDLGPLPEDILHPLVWFTAQVLSTIWSSRKENKKPKLFQTRATLEAEIAILRKTRHSNHCTVLEELVNTH